MESTGVRGMKKKKSKKSKGLVEKLTPSTDKDTNLLDPQHMELQKSSPNSLNEAAAAGSFEKQYFAHCFYRFREQVLVDAWPELESAAEKHGLSLTLHRAIKILNGDVHHEYIMVGHERGGLCLKHGITKEQFAKRWKRFTGILQDLAEIVGFTLYYTGNSITAVGDSLPHVKLIGHYVEACIVRNMKPASVLERVRARYDRCVVEMQLEALSI